MTEKNIWCEGCQCHYPTVHYGVQEEEYETHLVGEQYGWLGGLLYKAELYEKFQESLGNLIPESYDGDEAMDAIIVKWAEDVMSGNMPRLRKATGHDPHMPVFLLLAKDRFALPAISHYINTLGMNGLKEQSYQAWLAGAEFERWRATYPDLIKNPDHKHVPTDL